MKEEKKGGFEEELSLLKKKKAELLEALRYSSLDGDFSENADWAALNGKLDECQRRIFWLERALIEGESEDYEKIVTYLLIDSNELKQVKITSEWKEDAIQNKVAFSSPLGSSLLNKKAGEIVEVKTQGGSYKLKIIEVK